MVCLLMPPNCSCYFQRITTYMSENPSVTVAAAAAAAKSQPEHLLPPVATWLRHLWRPAVITFWR
jgi:hypothetical protein